MANQTLSEEDGFGFLDPTKQKDDPCINAGSQLRWLGAARNNPGLAATNQQVISIKLPRQLAAGTYTTTFTNSFVQAQYSFFLIAVANLNNTGTWNADTTAGRNVSCQVDNVSGTTVTLVYTTAQAMADDWTAHVAIITNN